MVNKVSEDMIKDAVQNVSRVPILPLATMKKVMTPHTVAGLSTLLVFPE